MTKQSTLYQHMKSQALPQSVGTGEEGKPHSLKQVSLKKKRSLVSQPDNLWFSCLEWYICKLFVPRKSVREDAFVQDLPWKHGQESLTDKRMKP